MSQSNWVSVNNAPLISHHSFAFTLQSVAYMVYGDPTPGKFVSFDGSEWTELEDFASGRGYGIGDYDDNIAYYGFGSSAFLCGF